MSWQPIPKPPGASRVPSQGVEDEAEMAWRKGFLRQIGCEL